MKNTYQKILQIVAGALIALLFVGVQNAFAYSDDGWNSGSASGDFYNNLDSASSYNDWNSGSATGYSDWNSGSASSYNDWNSGTATGYSDWNSGSATAYNYSGSGSYYSGSRYYPSSYYVGGGTWYGSYGTAGGYYTGGGYYGCGSNCGGGNYNPPAGRDLVIHCAANNSNILPGETVTWIAQASGANGNYKYTWTGSDGLVGQQKTLSKTYNTEGIKSATLTVKSGRQIKTVACTDLLVGERDIPNGNLQVSCSADDTSVETDDEVTWTAHVSGGNGNYSYDWYGSEGLDGSGRSVDIRYDDEGDKYAGVRVTSGGQTRDVRCERDVEVDDDNNSNDDIRVSCSADVTSTGNGQRVRWTANVSDEDGRVEYDWSGTDGLSGDDETVTEVYYTAGYKYARVEVEDRDGDTDEAQCSVYVGTGYTTYVPPTTTYVPPVAQASGIYLSQVPYTGIEDISLSLALFLASLALASGVIAYKIVKAKAKRDGMKSEVSTAEIETLARGAGLLFSRDALAYVSAVVAREKSDAKEVIAYVRSKIAQVEDSFSSVSLETAKKLIA